ncbi:putative M12B family metalloprotease [Flavobacterium limnosediminis JC2902]|uniref:Putative M12B family metalloprotease n=2 Tax=Flavobacterium TaxID=237 RepID=V6SS85_9FLAO|nr:putative M12B family metalloprotease [Flavobacterium limnosediminis JC2902]
MFTEGHAQTDRFWKPAENGNVTVSKTASRESFPKNYTLYSLDLNTLKQTLLSAPNRTEKGKSGVIISLPNTNGKTERFEMFEASNFDPELQAQFPEIRAYAGVGIDDKYAQVRLSIDPKGIQTMVFRADKKNEFMEPYSADGKVYAVFSSSREKGKLPFTCSTPDQILINDLSGKAATSRSSTGNLLTFRLALSCTAEYANYFGASSAAQVALVNAAFNATMTRVNGVFEKDFAIRMNIIAANNNVIFYNPATDPYSPSASMNNWNAELQSTLTTIIGEANYDVGHLFGADGGGGSAGCIGCVCTDGIKGRGITSPADAVPAGDTFDIDYVAHELGHQFGANHTFSHGSEPYNVNVEPGSGSTIMGYAGITSYNVQMNSDDYFHAASIAQVQANMVGKTCPTSTAITHGTPTVNAGADYTIPISTPFMLTGSATDPNGNPLVYTWEQMDSATTQTGANSVASPTKTGGPNWRSFEPTTSPTRIFPVMSAVLNGQTTSTGPGGIVVEALSSVARTLNFRLTARDNIAGGGQTNFDNVLVTVDAAKGPLTVTSQATSGISWTQGSTQTVTWTVNNTNTSPGGANVDILLSTDGGQTFPTVLLANTLNDGTQTITVPNIAAQQCRIMVKASGNVFFNVNAAYFAIGYTITTTCNTYSNTTPLVIPDATAGGPGAVVNNTISVPVITGTIYDVDVNLNVNHSWPSDLVIALNHPDNTQVTLWGRACAGNDNFNITLSDGSPAFTCVANMTGTFAPSSPLSAFNNKPRNGTWTLLASDFALQDTGQINSWSINVCTQTFTLATESFGLQDFTLYPNPNNGNFNVQFSSDTQNNVKIGVHDMRGRLVFEKEYQNAGIFNQNIQLTNVQSGVYIVTVQDGDRKEVKKISIK